MSRNFHRRENGEQQVSGARRGKSEDRGWRIEDRKDRSQKTEVQKQVLGVSVGAGKKNSPTPPLIGRFFRTGIRLGRFI